MKEHSDKIIFEVTGHDHLSDLRTAYDEDSSSYYMNKVVFPGLTSNTK